MCYVDAYYKEHVSIPSDASSDDGRPIPSKSSKKALYSLFHAINFIENWLKWFDESYQNRMAIHKSKMSELFETIPKFIPPKKWWL